MSAALVMPTESKDLLRPRRAPRSRCSGNGGGTACSTSAHRRAVDEHARGVRPVRSIRPPAGAWLAAVIPASRIAALFAQPAWPSTRTSQTGRSADRGVEIGGGREAAEPPDLLVPAAADDPAWAGLAGGIGGDPRLRLGEAGVSLRSSAARRGRGP